MTHPFRILSPIDAVADASPLPEDPERDEDRARRQRAAEAAAAEIAEQEARAELRKRAEEDGFAEGMRRGRDEALAAISAAIGPAVERLEAVRVQLEQDLENGRIAMAKAAITLGKTLAETLVGAPDARDRAGLLDRILSEAGAEAAPAALPLVCRAAPATLTVIGPALPDTVRPCA
ncbi:MAG: hypothetical protein KGK00_14300, partial [Paracoccaceae bacterium]|nr:hypothetical protein [Paracoccaceae bacterium]